MAITSKRDEFMTLLSGAGAMLAGQAQPAKMLGVATVAMFALLSTHRLSEGQQSKKVPRLCFLTFDPPASRSTRFEPFFEGLRGLGYEDGQTITIDYLSADGRGELFPALAAEVHLKADIIVASTTPATQAAKITTRC
jgi:putative ABC transport system substrate-binding protein